MRNKQSICAISAFYLTLTMRAAEAPFSARAGRVRTIVVRAVFALLFLSALTTPAGVKAQQWNVVGTADFVPGYVSMSSLAFSGSTPYVAYVDKNSERASLMKFDGANWVNVGKAGFSAGQVIFISLAFGGSTPYVAYTDHVNGGKATVMKFDGINWVTVGTAGFSAGEADFVTLVSNGPTPYVAYTDYGNDAKVMVKKFDGASWVTVGTAGASSTIAYFNSLAFSGSTPYVAYTDEGNYGTGGKATVRMFDGMNWINVGKEG